jgi:F-type H+-transporting ATPase subunit alpha
VDKTTQAQLTRGARMVEILKQDQYDPLPLAKQIMIIYSGIKGFLDDMPVNKIRKFETEFYKYLEKNHPTLERKIESAQSLDDSLSHELDQVIGLFKMEFLKQV